MIKKILLTGASGQVGIEIKNRAPKTITLISLNKQDLDITDAKAVKKIFETYKPDVVINASAYTAVDLAEKEPHLAYAVNIEGVSHLADQCLRLSIPLIHFSTDYIFDGKQHTPYKENDSGSPLNVYGKSKWKGEEVIRNTLKYHIILRTSWVFGLHGHNFVKTILRLAKQNKILRIVADQLGCPTAASDIAEVVWHMLDRDTENWGTYHFTNAPAISWYDFAKIIIEMKALKNDVIPILTKDYPALAIRPAYSVLDCEKIKSIFGIQQSDWRDALSKW